MKRTEFIILLFGIVLMAACKTDTKSITVINNLDIERSFETIEISKSDLKLQKEDDLYDYIIQDNTGVQQIVQYEDVNGNGSIDILLFQPKVAAKSSTLYTIVHLPNAELPERKEICYSRFVPERTDDYAWENDKVAFRVFGPTAQKMFEDGVEGGTLSSGVDCWLKRVDYPIINKWYQKNANGTGSYHEDTGEGLDNFHVGISRGCGGIALKKDSTYAVSKNFISYKTLMTGPIRTRFYLEYESWGAEETTIKETRIITLDAGNNLSKFEISIDGSKEISAGLTLHEKNGEVTVNSENNWVSYWEQHKDSELGTGIVTTTESLIGFDTHDVDKKDLSNVYMHLKPNNKKIVYYTGFGWKKSKQFDNKMEWNNYLDMFSKRLQSPLKLQIN